MSFYNEKSGFTLLEMLVSITIITIFAIVVLGKRSDYSDLVALKSQVYNVALYVRKAQVDSFGVKGFKRGSNPVVFDKPYGVYFNNSSSQTGQFRFFTDEGPGGVPDGKYQNGETNTLVLLNEGVRIQSLCGRVGGVERCNFASLRSITVSFKRPEYSALLEATIGFQNPGNNNIPTYSAPARINLISRGGKVASIKIESTGAVSVEGI